MRQPAETSAVRTRDALCGDTSVQSNETWWWWQSRGRDAVTRQGVVGTFVGAECGSARQGAVAPHFLLHLLLSRLVVSPTQLLSTHLNMASGSGYEQQRAAAPPGLGGDLGVAAMFQQILDVVGKSVRGDEVVFHCDIYSRCIVVEL